MEDLADLEKRTCALMRDLGEQVLGRSLLELGWTFRYDRARRRLGSCKWRRTGRKTEKAITLSRHYARLEGRAMMEDVARHEIAHAIDFELRGKSDHGPQWKRLARACGADPTRLYEGGTPDTRDSRYVGICPACGKEHAFYRRLKRAHACPDCCDAHNEGRYTERFKLRLVERATIRPGRPEKPPTATRKNP